MGTVYRKVADLDLSIRTKNLLKNAGINTLQELVSYTKSDLMKFRNIGRSSLVELEVLVLKNNLSFGTLETIKSDNTQTLQNALQQIEKLKADKAELLELRSTIEEFRDKANKSADNLHKRGLQSSGMCSQAMETAYNLCLIEIESLIQKMKKCQENTPR